MPPPAEELENSHLADQEVRESLGARGHRRPESLLSLVEQCYQRQLPPSHACLAGHLESNCPPEPMLGQRLRPLKGGREEVNWGEGRRGSKEEGQGPLSLLSLTILEKRQPPFLGGALPCISSGQWLVPMGLGHIP